MNLGTRKKENIILKHNRNYFGAINIDRISAIFCPENSQYVLGSMMSGRDGSSIVIDVANRQKSIIK